MKVNTIDLFASWCEALTVVTFQSLAVFAVVTVTCHLSLLHYHEWASNIDCYFGFEVILCGIISLPYQASVQQSDCSTVLLFTSDCSSNIFLQSNKNHPLQYCKYRFHAIQRCFVPIAHPQFSPLVIGSPVLYLSFISPCVLYLGFLVTCMFVLCVLSICSDSWPASCRGEFSQGRPYWMFSTSAFHLVPFSHVERLRKVNASASVMCTSL